MTTPNKPGAARAIADVTGGVILATVEIAAPPERVFRAISSAEMTKWWGSDDTYRTTGWTGDLRVGGRWRAEGRGNDGKPFAVEGEFLEIDPPRKLVQTWNPSWDQSEPTKITYLLEPTADGTRIVLRHEGFGRRHESCNSHANGWERVLGWLQKHMEPAAAESGGAFFVCRLLPPRATFMQDMTADELVVMQAHAVYWQAQLQAGNAILFGPVADPKGGWGLGVVRAADEAAVRAFEAGDPVIKSGRGFRYEILPMLRAVF
jgi:uncharacterized protein YndB with AHSA1/START domain